MNCCAASRTNAETGAEVRTLQRRQCNGSGSDSEAPTKHNSQVWFVAACGLGPWRRAEKSSSSEYRIDRLDQMTHSLRLQDVPLRPSLTYFDSQPLGVMSGKDQNRDSKPQFSHSRRRFKSTHAWHRNVENHQIWF